MNRAPRKTRPAPGVALREANISRAPATVADAVWVLVTAEIEAGPCPWPARGVLLPAVGDRALVARSDEGAWWVVAWWPYPLVEV